MSPERIDNLDYMLQYLRKNTFRSIEVNVLLFKKKNSFFLFGSWQTKLIVVNKQDEVAGKSLWAPLNRS